MDLANETPAESFTSKGDWRVSNVDAFLAILSKILENFSSPSVSPSTQRLYGTFAIDYFFFLSASSAKSAVIDYCSEFFVPPSTSLRTGFVVNPKRCKSVKSVSTNLDRITGWPILQFTTPAARKTGFEAVFQGRAARGRTDTGGLAISSRCRGLVLALLVSY
jgi:hypothetical protein